MAGIVVKPRARILHGHDWVFSSEVLKVFGNPGDGDVISLKDGRDRLIGSAIYNSKSQIVARRFSRRRQDLDFDFFRRRIAQASEYRDRRNVDPKLRRIVWSESDGLPGVIIDRYGEEFVLQTLTLAMDLRKDLIVEAMDDVFCRASASLAGTERLAGGAPALQTFTIVERNDAPVRKAEGLEVRSSVLRGTPSQIAIEIEGITLELDLLHGQKTGFYLDQQLNYGIVARCARDRRVLDCFSNQGAFALVCARGGAAEVIGSAGTVRPHRARSAIVYEDEDRTAQCLAWVSGIAHARVRALIERRFAGDILVLASHQRRGLFGNNYWCAGGCSAFSATRASVRTGA